MAGDSNPHSADQKHQSLNYVLLTRHDHDTSDRMPKEKATLLIDTCAM